jgi:hypothetical protein
VVVLLKPRWVLAAATVIVVALVPLVLDRTSDPAPDRERAAALVAIAPAGDVGELPAFRWRSRLAAASFIVEVLDRRGAIVYSARASGEALEPDLEMRARLTAPGTYRWRVSAFDAAGDRMATSEPRTFTLKD